MKVVLVETGMGNVHSCERALRAAGPPVGLDVSVERTADPKAIVNASRLVVPGQGAFLEGARALTPEIRQALMEAIKKGTPYLGICLGLQLLFESSEEAPGAEGLGVFKGTCRRLQGSSDIKIPHMGWNRLETSASPHRYLAAAGGDGAWMYFVHSYHAVADDPKVVCAVAQHGENQITAAIQRDNVFATQFHVEKSQGMGLQLLSAFFRD